MIRALNRTLRRGCAFAAGLCMAAVFAIIFFNSLRRYTVGKSLEWGEELPVYLTIYGVMFGAALAYVQDRHIRFTFLADVVSPRSKEIVYAAIDLVVVAIAGLLAWSGWLFMVRRGGVEASGIIGPSRDLADALGMAWLEAFGHMAVWQFAMFLGGVVLAVAALLKFCDRVATLRAGEG